MGIWAFQGAEKRKERSICFQELKSISDSQQGTNTVTMDAIWFVRGKLHILLGIYCHKPAAYTGLEKGIRKCTTQLKTNVLFISCSSIALSH